MQATWTRSSGFRHVISALLRHQGILTSRYGSLCSLHRLVCLDLLVNYLKI